MWFTVLLFLTLKLFYKKNQDYKRGYRLEGNDSVDSTLKERLITIPYLDPFTNKSSTMTKMWHSRKHRGLLSNKQKQK